MHKRNFIQQRGTQSFYYLSQLFSSSSKIYLGNFRNFAGFSRYQSLYQWQWFKSQCALQIKPTESHSYLLHSSSHLSHVKNSIPYSQFLRLRRLCSDVSDFSNKSQEMCQFFEKRGYPATVIQTAHHRAQQTDRQSALQTSQKEKNDRIPFTLTITQ